MKDEFRANPHPKPKTLQIFKEPWLFACYEHGRLHSNISPCRDEIQCEV